MVGQLNPNNLMMRMMHSSSELESQYGIPAKHFMGKKEMAYALAVEREDRAMKEGGGYILDDDDDINSEMNGGTC